MTENSAKIDGASMPSHLVLVNHEGQYSLWPATKEVPNGWTRVFEGTQEACLAHVEETWTDMRPLSIREPAV
jgi:MbtH protein